MKLLSIAAILLYVILVNVTQALCYDSPPSGTKVSGIIATGFKESEKNMVEVEFRCYVESDIAFDKLTVTIVGRVKYFV